MRLVVVIIITLHRISRWAYAAEKGFLTQREDEAFLRECGRRVRREIMEVTERTRLARESLSTSRILVVEIPEQWTTFGHFVMTVVDKRATALRVAAATNRALFFKNCRYEDDPDAILSMELVKTHATHLHNCANDYIDFEQFFGLPNRTSTAFPRNGTRLKRIEDPAQVDHDALAITMTVWTAVKLAELRPVGKCERFATTRPVGDAWDHLEETARNVDKVAEVVGLHLRTGYADHGKKMDHPFDAKGNLLKLSQFEIAYPEMLRKSLDMPRGSKEWMDVDFAALSPRRFPGADDILACRPEPLFKLLALSQTVECLDSRRGKKTGVVISTDHATYYPIMLDQVRKSRLLVPDRVRNKQAKDTTGHFWHTSTYAKTRGRINMPIPASVLADTPDWHGLGLVAALELYLLTYCDLLVTYGPSVYQRAAQHLAVSDSFKMITLNMAAPGQLDDPTFQLVDSFCSSGCYSKHACDCARTPTKNDYHVKEGFIPH